MKATLEFDLPQEQDEFEAAVGGQIAREKLDAIWDVLFRPALKHGYVGLRADDLNAYVAYVAAGPDGKDVITMLSERYRDLIKDI